MLRTRLSCALVGALIAAGALAQAEERTESGPAGDFSITFPSSWRSVPSSVGDYSQLALYADRPFDISIVIGSRPLDQIERALDRRRLLDRMIEQTMITTARLGNEIVQVGRVDSVLDDWPAFAAVVTNGDRSKIMTTLRTFVADRSYFVATMTDNQQAGTELGALVTQVVRSLTLHPPEPESARSLDAPRRQASSCHWW